MKANRRVLKYAVVLSLLPALLTTAHALDTVRIVQPEPGESLSGKTLVVVDVSQARRVDQVLVYVDLFPQPVCRITEPPFECEVDADPLYQGRSIRALAVKRNGQPVGMGSVVTLGFPEPVRAVDRLTRSSEDAGGE